ncbi:MAG: protein of unknown function DUF1749 [Microgenomates bacterium 39_7]|nr:MAG: protein of unknown function DUF1749 [Microgenomates bacterium 39_7]
MKQTFSTQLIEFPTSDNLMLPGLLFTPKNLTNKAAIFLHGNGSASVFYSPTRAHALAQALTQRGIALLLFNNRGAHFFKTINRVEDPEAKVDSNYNDVTLGTAYELIKDCIHDINGAIAYLHQLNFQEFHLIGHSSGANKICVYDHYQPKNIIKKYVLLGGGDDTGILYTKIGSKQKFKQYLKQAEKKIEQGKGRNLIPKYILDRWLSYQSFYDTINPDGNYNTFPFTEYLRGLNLSTKPLFRYFKGIKKPTLIVYGENDDYAPSKSGLEANKILRKQVSGKKNFTFEIVSGADHSFHYQEDQLGEVIGDWLG